MSLRDLPNLVSLVLYLQLHDDTTVPILRNMFKSSHLPALRHLELLFMSTDAPHPHPTEEYFYPFGQEPPPNPAPIFPISVVEHLETLKFTFLCQPHKEALVIHNASLFLGLFGVTARDEVLTMNIIPSFVEQAEIVLID
jgi:hypothetical protein